MTVELLSFHHSIAVCGNCLQNAVISASELNHDERVNFATVNEYKSTFFSHKMTVLHLQSTWSLFQVLVNRRVIYNDMPTTCSAFSSYLC